ncbi:MerR family transcriptional regulator [Pseudonocardia endophytica]|uniref:DNA-binding transcriptional MerR regulator n=1 Tax=Pseudonocardia endophytica TaxID=401976 RepID=A0A4R1HY11_PSEEN|nr:MerR family transcriptional regulator [Pseudonocardia endophytica]TCK27694.1 DNA-binding transcriptional MerR regulator [Pseudonocardia endophytica]
MDDDGWFLIAEFARRCRLPVSALRYYDGVGLLRPAYVDPATGYRRYRAEQLDDAVTIARLRAVGTGPDVIARVLAGGEARERALAGERRRLAGEIRRLTDGLAELDDLGRAPVVGDPERVLLEPEDVVAWPFTAAGDELAGTIRRGVATLRTRLRRRGRTVVRWGAVLPLDVGDTVSGHVIARPDGGAPAGPDKLRLPGGEAITVVHSGPRASLASAYRVLLDAAGPRAAGPVVEWYPVAASGPSTPDVTGIAVRTRAGDHSSDSPRMNASTLS